MSNLVTKKNLKKVILWTAIASLISLVFENYNIFDFIGMSEETYDQIVEKVLYVLVLLGVLTNQEK